MSSLPYGVKTTLLTLSWFPVLYSFSNHVFSPYQITGSSMTPTFNAGTETTTNDIVLVRKYNLKKPDSFDRGDIILFRSPTDPEKVLTKRVVGLQGDTVKPKHPPYPRDEARVPRNHLWVEGDNTFHSVDSNNFGPISQGLVVGKVVTVIWPLSRFGADVSSGGRDARKGLGDISVKSINDI